MTPYRHKPRLTIPELRKIVEFFHGHFPNWAVIRKDTLVRIAGPVVQGITFERLSGGSYRPTGYIRVLVAPEEFWGFELPQELNVRLRQIDRHQDTSEFRERVVEAIRNEFLPNVDLPLTADQVLALYEEKAYPSPPQACSLAALSAFLGHDERALYWCSRFRELVNATGNPWQPFDLKRGSFLELLERWLKSGNARQELERVLQGECAKWGLASNGS